MNFYQHTLQRSTSSTGIGLHSGKKINLVLRPAEPDTGIVFKRTDLSGSPLIPGDVYNVVDTHFCTTLAQNNVTVSTVEHLLSALYAMGVDNAIVETDAPEIPIMDGSSAPFLLLLRYAGLARQNKLRQFYIVKREVTIQDNDRFVKIIPASEELSVDFSIAFSHPAIREQRLRFLLSSENYVREISKARTFGFLADMQKLHENGLALGGSLKNAVVMDDFNVINKEGLRFKDEFVRHKILDFVGDLALIGRPVLGHFVVHKSGHDLNNRLFRKFLADSTAWQLVNPQQLNVPEYGNLQSLCPQPPLTVGLSR
ncbi:MAG: UDP-3-O-acyl-N-acetylglucosamine deacetylase [Desulfarculales bacterium]|jgi:UDP-3-O-[3-hydroxymyristoyl] N-acetylglucosamine deacetylase|nr:UDP-3-O-acyl-N-acetylglucosamine deacetylase [Desulfarculales bacterium]